MPRFPQLQDEGWLPERLNLDQELGTFSLTSHLSGGEEELEIELIIDHT